MSDPHALRSPAPAALPARASHPASLLLTAAALLLGACSEPPAYDLRHPFDAMPELALRRAAVGDTTRPFAAFPPGRHELALGPVRSGFLRTHLAVTAEAEAGNAVATISLRDGSFAARLRGGVAASCSHEWNEGFAKQAWLECRLPIPHHLSDARLTVEFESPSPTTELRVASPILVADDATPLPDVFVIVIDTARADVFSPYDERLPSSPNLAALAGDAIVFEELRAPSSWTRASVATLITGLSQTRHQVFNRLHPLPAGLPTLQQHLHDHGYQSMAWSSNPNILPIWGFAEGFDEFVDVGVANWQTDKPDADVVLARARAGFDANAGVPGFYYLHLMDPHHPYKPPAADARLMRSLVGDRPELYPTPALERPDAHAVRRDYQNYLAEVRDLDRKLGSFLDHLRESGRYDAALILVVSDHGEEFLDHGDRYHGISLYEEALRVPGILKLPRGERAGERIARPVGLVDMFATLAGVLGFDPPREQEGVDVLGAETPELPQVAQLVLDQYRKTAIKFEGWKLIVDHVRGTKELYDLTGDPQERNDRFASESERVALLEELLDRMAALHEEGWHLRGCGCASKATLEFALSSEAADAPRWIGSEAGDHFEAQAGPDAVARGFDVAMKLQPTLSQQMRFGRRIKRFLADEDELVWSAPDGAPAGFDFELTPTAAAGLRIAVGQGEPERIRGARAFTADSSEALVDVGEPVNCRDPRPAAARPSEEEGPACEPYVRIWRVEAARGVSESSIDPAISERLKALGYQW